MQSVRLALVVLALASLAAAAVSSGGSYEDDNVQASMKALSNDVEIKLYTRHNTEKGQALSVDSPELLESSFFDPLQPTKIIVHGWLSDQTNNTGGDLIKDALLEVSPYNVILIDWSGADSPNYLTSRLQVPDLGRLVGKLIRQLAESAGLDYSDLHLIGHSLGAHVMGFAGRSAGLGDKGRITGIDPAGPLFWNDPSVRLDKTDAGFVDVIHTCTPTLGYVGPIGHVDYYPNGGAWVQPGCDFFQSACSHCRGYSLLIESIESPGAFIATACSSWWNYRNGKCKSNEQVELGLGTNREARGSFFFATNADPPYSQTASIPASDTLMLSKNILKC